MNRLFLLSPANASGRRAALLVRPEARFELACRLRAGSASLGEVFTFCSGLYFRGKLAYARRFAQPPNGLPGVHVITPTRGLLTPDAAVALDDLREFAGGGLETPGFARELGASARRLCGPAACEVVLLGSIATPKYVEALLPVFGDRLLFPAEFVGRGDMSRGGLLLRSAASGVELHCIPVSGAVRRGRRPPKLGSHEAT